jgi:hypothetical protein
LRKTSDAPVKVSDRTKERVRYAAVLSGRSQGEVLDAAVDEYITRHAEDFAVGLKRARSALFNGDEAAVAYLLDEDEEAVRRVSGAAPQKD